MSKIRPLAIYLPQFHPIPENDKWWGKGFTEWTNVTKAKPRFDGHYQPHLPADLGFYDLRLHETMIQQAALARAHGIHGFMFYHYWFSGKRLLERPVNQWVEQQSPDFPFCLCWANENWTRRWDGDNTEVLMRQEYTEEDDKAHFQELLKYFKDKRYITVDGKPLFVIYRIGLFPDIKRTAALWRAEALKNGLPGLYLVNVDVFGKQIDPVSIGFDAAMEFQPEFFGDQVWTTRYYGGLKDKVLNKFGLKKSPFLTDRVFDYDTFVQMQLKNAPVPYKRFRGITPMWDNSPRRKLDAFMLRNSTPTMYGYWLESVIKNFTPYSTEENFIFINAWNEWAEGNHLEPCQRWGDQYLKTTKQVLENSGSI